VSATVQQQFTACAVRLCKLMQRLAAEEAARGKSTGAEAEAPARGSPFAGHATFAAAELAKLDAGEPSVLCKGERTMKELHATLTELHRETPIKGEVFFEASILHHVLSDALTQPKLGWKRLVPDAKNRWQNAARGQKTTYDSSPVSSSGCQVVR